MEVEASFLHEAISQHDYIQEIYIRMKSQWRLKFTI